jgi:DNA polymerase/3'-5' exonuclease PolX
MNLAHSQSFARKIVDWLSPYCHRLEIAGSIRRARPQCADIDIVCIPKVTEEKDMLGSVLNRNNRCLWFLKKYVAEYAAPASAAPRPRFVSGGEKEGKQCIIELPKCQLDLWFACEKTFASRLLMRTGSKEHNIWLATRAADYGLHWFPYFGFCPESKAALGGDRAFELGHILPAASEADLYRHLRLDFIPPEHREIDWLTKNIDSGL